MLLLKFRPSETNTVFRKVQKEDKYFPRILSKQTYEKEYY